jgi:FeS assembly SUF system protein
MEENTTENTQQPTESLSMHDQIIEAIKTVFDPEIPVNIYELGLIYEVKIGDEGKVDISMTLTSPGCPAAGMLPGDVEEKVRSVPGVTDVSVEVTFEPPWDQSMMSEEARLELGFM